MKVVRDNARRLVRVSAVALSITWLAPLPAFAQAIGNDTVADGPSDGIEEIVVTARRVEENLQDVPVSVTAISERELEARRIVNVADIAQVVPNVVIREQFGIPGTPEISIRGINGGLTDFSVDSGLGLYVDSVYIGRAVGSIFSVADLAQVEVLRGP